MSWFVLLFTLERLYSASPLPSFFSSQRLRQRVFKNLSVSLINALLSPLLIIPSTLFLITLFPTWRPEWMGHALFFLVDLLILELFLYWWHRANHEIPFLWRFHQVHHLDQTLDSTTALRFHFGEVFMSAVVRSCVVVLAGIPLSSVIIFEIAILLFSVFNHSNVRLPSRLEKRLSLIIVTPAIHWVHHHAVRKDTDSNYATIFSFWDKLFGSRSSSLRVKSMPIGVEKMEDVTLSRLLIQPFK